MINLNYMLKVKLLWGIIFLAGFLLLSTDDVKASHVVGSDIMYECVPGAPPGTFRIRLILYRDCAGIPMCPNNCGAACSRQVQIQGADPSCNGQNFGNVTVSLVSVRDVNPIPECPNLKNTCTNMGCVQPGTYTPAVERYEFAGTVNLNALGIPASCCNVRMVWEECCRNSAITTGASGQNFFMEAIVNRCLSSNPCNSSPTLTNDPYAFACQGQPFTFNNGAVDPDLDSITYEFTPSLQGANSSVTYVPPYAFDRPMPWTGPAGGQFPAGISCDPQTGDIMFTPGGSSQVIGVMAILVKQWKTINGVPTVIGVTRRDIQMMTRPCPPNNPPRIKTNPPGPGNMPKLQWDVCAGDQLCFDVIAKDTDFNPPTLSDTTYLKWNAALARFGATFVPNYNPAQRKTLGPREDSYKFCWTPGEERASTTPYYFNAIANDGLCKPFPGVDYKTFIIRVRPKPDVTLRKIDLKCGKFQVTYDIPVNKPAQTFTFRSYQISRKPGDFSFVNGAHTFNNVQTTPIINFTEGGKYLVQLAISSPGPIGGAPCTKTFYDTITVDTPVLPIARDTFVCIGSSVQMQATAKYGRMPYNYRWYNNINDTVVPLNGPIFTNGNITVAPSQTRNYTIQVRDVNGCRVYDSVTVEVRRLPIGTLPDSLRLCYGDTTTLNPGNDGGRVKKFLWSTGDTAQSIVRGDSNTFIVRLTDTSGCVQTDTMKLFVNRQVIPNAGMDTSICMNDTATLTASGGQLYVWKNLTTNVILSAKSHNRTIRVNPTNTTIPTQYEVTVYQSYPDTTSRYLECMNRDTVTVTVNPLPVLTRPQPIQACKSTNLINAPVFGVNLPGGIGVWSYVQAPGAIVNGTVTQFRVDSLKNIPTKDTIRSFDNWIVYKYTAPVASGGCTRTDSTIVRIYGNPPVTAGKTLNWCENAGIYSITPSAQLYSPSSATNSAFQEEWTGNGIYSTTVGLTKQHFFDPNRPGVFKLPGFNVQKYKYTHVYNPNNPSIRIDCVNEDTVIFNVTPIPIIDAGSNVSICKSEPVFNIAAKAGATISPLTGKSYWVPAPSSATYPGNALVKPALNDSLTFNTSSPAVPNPANTIIPPATEPGAKRYLLYFEDRSTGCLVRDSMVLTVVRVPEVSISFASAAADSPLVCKTQGDVMFNCVADNSGRANNMVYGGSGAFKQFGSGVTLPNGVLNTQDALAQPSNMMVYSWTLNAAGISCSNSDTTYLNIQTPPTIDVVDGGSICAYRDTIAVAVSSVGPGYNHTWSTQGGGRFADSSALITFYFPDSMDKVNGTVWLKASTNAKDKCPTIADSTTITIHKVPVAYTDSRPESCVPLDAQFVAGNPGVPDGVTYTWNWLDGQTSTGPTMSRTFSTYEGTGKHGGVLHVVTDKGCEAIGPFGAITHAIPKADFATDPETGVTTIAKPFFNFYNQSYSEDNSRMSYLWKLGKDLNDTNKMRTSTEHSPMNVEYEADTGWQTVWLRTTTEFGCADSIEKRIRINPDITVFIPNAFYPGSTVPCRDGTPDCNKKFRVAADGHLTIEIFIFNRWGQQVYYSTDANDGWDGRMNNGKDGGQDCQQDVYIYQVNATSFNGKKYKYSGSVTLLR